jgi:hypothetical protein
MRTFVETKPNLLTVFDRSRLIRSWQSLESLMVSDKSLYWIAALVVVFGFGHRQFCGHDDWAGSVKDRIASVTDRVSRQADRLLPATEFVLREGETGMVRSQVKMALTQQSLACMQASMARRQADFARLEASRGRLMAIEQMRRGAFHPLPNFVVNLPQVNVPQSPVLMDDGGTL